MQCRLSGDIRDAAFFKPTFGVKSYGDRYVGTELRVYELCEVAENAGLHGGVEALGGVRGDTSHAFRIPVYDSPDVEADPLYLFFCVAHEMDKHDAPAYVEHAEDNQ